MCGNLASASSQGPASETVGNIGRVATGSSEGVVEVVVVDRAAVVHASRGIVVTSTIVVGGSPGLVKSLAKTITVGGSGSAVADHLDDLVVGARVDTGAVTGAVVGLHETRVADTVVGHGSADTALGLLHDNGEDVAPLNTSLARDLDNSVPDVVDLRLGVISAPAVPAARLAHERLVDAPELVPGAPGRSHGPALRRGAVAVVHDVAVVDGAGVELLGGGCGRGDGDHGESSEKDVGKHLEKILIGNVFKKMKS